MDKLRHILFRSWSTLETFEDRIYHIVLDVAAFVSLISVVTGLLQGLPPISIWVTAGVLLYLIVLRFVTMRFPKYADVCRVLLVLGVNLVLFPLQFFASGGIYSGMILFFLIGIGLTAMLLRGRTAMLVGLLSVVVMAASIILSVHYPALTQKMTVAQHRDDMIVTLALSGVTLFSIIALMLRAYTQERGQNEQLMERLHDLSVRDGLTGLYNRRELFHRLEEVYGGGDLAGKYIAMFDADGFKALNDAYGHSAKAAGKNRICTAEE